MLIQQAAAATTTEITSTATITAMWWKVFLTSHSSKTLNTQNAQAQTAINRNTTTNTMSYAYGQSIYEDCKYRAMVKKQTGGQNWSQRRRRRKKKQKVKQKKEHTAVRLQEIQIERCTVNFWFKFLKQCVTIDSRQQLVIAIASTTNEKPEKKKKKSKR